MNRSISALSGMGDDFALLVMLTIEWLNFINFFQIVEALFPLKKKEGLVRKQLMVWSGWKQVRELTKVLLTWYCFFLQKL